MKKVKISELPLHDSLKGLYTIGTDDQNRSVKVSLEFVETKTEQAVKDTEKATADAIAQNKTATDTAVKNANDAAAKALTAKTQADTATESAKTATSKADAATAKANTAAANADTATSKANTATDRANASAVKADTATANANKATKQTLDAKTKTETATTKATTATEEANNATKETLAVKSDITAMLQRLIPTGLAVSCIKRITISNPQPVFIKAVLTPTDALQNIIFISDNSDNRACFVTTDGRIRVLSEGISTIQVIPTCNTALAKTITIEVGKPLARLNTLKSLRLSSDRAFRLT